jgi:hypothetical protein
MKSSPVQFKEDEVPQQNCSEANPRFVLFHGLLWRAAIGTADSGLCAVNARHTKTCLAFFMSIR